MNKYVLITGGSNGLGYELVKAHLAAGFHVFSLDLNFNEKIDELESKNTKLQLLACDLSSTESVNNAIGIVKQKTQKLDRIFNNAGIFRFEDWVHLEETDLDFVKTMVDINAVGALRVMKACLPLLSEGSVVVYTSSEAGSLTDCFADALYAYCMSKTAMNMGARILDNELREKKIRTLMIHPGRMKTERMGGPHSEIFPSETAENLLRLVSDIDSIDKETLFMNYKGEPMAW